MVEMEKFTGIRPKILRFYKSAEVFKNSGELSIRFFEWVAHFKLWTGIFNVVFLSNLHTMTNYEYDIKFIQGLKVTYILALLVLQIFRARNIDAVTMFVTGKCINSVITNIECKVRRYCKNSGDGVLYDYKYCMRYVRGG